MENVFRFPIEIDFRYDLKGSTYNRKGKTDEWSKNVALKDQDFLDEERKLDMQQSSKLKYFLINIEYSIKSREMSISSVSTIS